MAMKNEVFILGSGFSKELFSGMPLLNELTVKITDTIDKDNSIFNNIYKNYIKNINILNFEDILTYLYQEFPWKSEKDYHLLYSLYVHISELLVKVFRDIQSGIDYKTLLNRSYISNFLLYLHHTQTTVISLNYDTLLEEVSKRFLRPFKYIESSERGRNFRYLKEITYLVDTEQKQTSSSSKIKYILDKENKKIEIYFYDYSITEEEFNAQLSSIKEDDIKADLENAYRIFTDNLAKPYIDYLDLYPIPIQLLPARTTTLFAHDLQDTFKLFKLHGSINWYYSGSKTQEAEQIYLVGSTKISEEEDKNLKDLVPVIIPPVLDKTGFFKQNTIRSQWNEAKNFLRKADRVYIIGYSIPPTDLTVKFMLQSFINKESEVFIINKDEGNKKYFKEIFNKCNDKYIKKDGQVFESFVKEILSL